MKNNKDMELEGLNSIIGRLAKSLGIERGLREITLIGLWPQIVGPRFKDKSKAVSVIRKGEYDILLVAVASSVVSQELFLYKKDLIRKLTKPANSLHFKIRDLIFNLKLWDELKDKPAVQEKKEEVTHFFVKNPSDSELKDITVPDAILDSIRESVKTQNFSSDELKDRLMHTIVNDIKTQIWRKNNGFPCCKICGIPVNYYNPDNEVLCPSCKYSK